MGLAIPAKKFIKFLEENGYSFVRANGTSHRIYTNGKRTVSVPAHTGKDMGESMIHKVLSEAGFVKHDLSDWLGR